MTDVATNNDDVEKQASKHADDVDKVPEGTLRRYARKHEPLKSGSVRTKDSFFNHLLVPASWEPSSGLDDDYVEGISQALKMIPPKLVFQTMTIAEPDDNDDEFVNNNAAYRGVVHFLKEVAEQCGKDGAYYLLHRPNSAIEKIILEKHARITLLQCNLIRQSV